MNRENERHMLEAIEGSPLGYYVESLTENLQDAYEEITRLKAQLKKTHQSLVNTRFEQYQDEKSNTKLIEEKDKQLADARMDIYSRQSMDFEENRTGFGTKAYWKR